MRQTTAQSVTCAATLHPGIQDSSRREREVPRCLRPGAPTVVPGRKNGGAQLVYPPHGDPRRGSRSGRDVRIRGLFIFWRLGRPVGCGLDCRIRRSDRSRIHRRIRVDGRVGIVRRKRIGGSLRRRFHGRLGRSVGWRVGSEHGQPRRGREGRRQPHDHRPAARLVQLRQGHRRLLAEIRDQDQRAQPRWWLEGRARAITANKDNKGPAAPDVVDVGLAFGPQGVSQGLYQPYKVSTWDSIPDSAKSADGMWYGDYFGVMSFEVNTAVAKTTPEGLGGPTQAGLQEHGLAVR